MNVMGVSEMRWNGAERILADEHELIHSGENVQERGVGQSSF